MRVSIEPVMSILPLGVGTVGECRTPGLLQNVERQTQTRPLNRTESRSYLDAF